MKRLSITLVLLLCAMAPALAQDDPATENETVIYTLKYLEANEARRLVLPLVSRTGNVQMAGELNRLIITDKADVIATIREVLDSADVKPDSIMLTIYTYWAYPGTEGSVPEQAAEGVRAALKEVAELLPYKSFEQVGRGAVQLSAASRNGSLQLSDQFSVEFNVYYRQEAKFMLLDGFRVIFDNPEQGPRQVFRSDINISDGETVVAGVSRPNGDQKALVSIVSMEVK